MTMAQHRSNGDFDDTAKRKIMTLAATATPLPTGLATGRILAAYRAKGYDGAMLPNEAFLTLLLYIANGRYLARYGQALLAEAFLASAERPVLTSFDTIGKLIFAHEDYSKIVMGAAQAETLDEVFAEFGLIGACCEDLVRYAYQAPDGLALESCKPMHSADIAAHFKTLC